MLDQVLARLRIQAFMPNNITRKGKARGEAGYGIDIDLTTIYRRAQRLLESQHKSLRLVATLPGKLSFYRIPLGTSKYYILAKTGQVVGYVTIYDGHIYLLYVDAAFAGKGYGETLLEQTLHQERVLRSSASLSKGATKLWQRLITKHSGQLMVPKPSGKPRAVDIVGWNVVAGFTYPVVTKDGKPVSLYKLLTSKDPAERLAAQESYYVIKT